MGEVCMITTMNASGDIPESSIPCSHDQDIFTKMKDHPFPQIMQIRLDLQ